MSTREKDLAGVPINGGRFATPTSKESPLNLPGSPPAPVDDGSDFNFGEKLSVAEDVDYELRDNLRASGLRGAIRVYDGSEHLDVSDAAVIFKSPLSENEVTIDPDSDEGFTVRYDDRFDEANSFRIHLDEGEPTPKEIGETVKDVLFGVDLANAVYSSVTPEKFEIRVAELGADAYGDIRASVLFSAENDDGLSDFGYINYNYSTGEASLADCDNSELTVDAVVKDFFPESTAQQGFDKFLGKAAISPFKSGNFQRAITGVDMEDIDSPNYDREFKETIFDESSGSWSKTSDMEDLNHEYTSTVEGIEVKVRDDYTGAIVQYEVWDNRETGVSRQLTSGNGQNLEEVMALARGKRDQAFHYGTNENIHEGAKLPWGISAGSERTLPGVDYVWAKGGLAAFKLTENRNADVHPAWRNEDGFYNEKVAWVIPTLTHHGEYTRDRVTKALDIAKKEYGPQLATAIRTDPKRYGALKDW